MRLLKQEKSSDWNIWWDEMATGTQVFLRRKIIQIGKLEEKNGVLFIPGTAGRKVPTLFQIVLTSAALL